MEATNPPTAIRRLPDEQMLLVEWPDGLACKLGLVAVRAQCMCARCVDEITGQRIVSIDGIDPAIQIDQLQLVGNYAVRFHWSDGHHQGLYTWQHLRGLCQAG